MNSITKTLAAVTTAGVASLAGITAALAVPVTPVVLVSTAGGISGSSLPGASDYIVDVQPDFVDVSSSLSPGGAESAAGAALVDVDTTDINASVAKSVSNVSTAATSPPAPDSSESSFNFSLASYAATLSTEGLAPGGTATVDLTLFVNGVLIYTDPTGNAVTIVDDSEGDPIEVSDMSASVSVLLTIADPFVIPDDPSLLPDPLPFLPKFNGAVTLQAPKTQGGKPELVRTADWQAAERDGDFVGYDDPSECFPGSCRVEISMMLTFSNLYPLGVSSNEAFDVGLILLTNADMFSDTGRIVTSDFYNSANFAVELTAASIAQAPEPGTLLLLALAIVGLALMQWRRRK